VFVCLPRFTAPRSPIHLRSLPHSSDLLACALPQSSVPAPAPFAPLRIGALPRTTPLPLFTTSRVYVPVVIRSWVFLVRSLGCRLLHHRWIAALLRYRRCSRSALRTPTTLSIGFCTYARHCSSLRIRFAFCITLFTLPFIFWVLSHACTLPLPALHCCTAICLLLPLLHCPFLFRVCFRYRLRVALVLVYLFADIGFVLRSHWIPLQFLPCFTAFSRLVPLPCCSRLIRFLVRCCVHLAFGFYVSLAAFQDAFGPGLRLTRRGCGSSKRWATDAYPFCLRCVSRLRFYDQTFYFHASYAFPALLPLSTGCCVTLPAAATCVTFLLRSYAAAPPTHVCSCCCCLVHFWCDSPHFSHTFVPVIVRYCSVVRCSVLRIST